MRIRIKPASTKKVLRNICLLTPFFEPYIVSYYDTIGSIFSLCRIVITLFLLKDIIFRKNYPIVYMITLFELLLMFSTVMTNTITIGYIASCLGGIGFVLLNIRLIKGGLSEYGQGYSILLGVYFIIHFFTVIVFPNGMISGMLGDNRIWFLGRKNSLICDVLIFLIMYIVCCYIRYNKIKNSFYIYLIIFAICFLVTGSITSFGAIILIMMLLTFLKVKNRKRVIIGTIVAIVVVITLLNVSGLYGTIIEFITNLFSREMTFSGRISIWKLAIDYFKKNILFGQGVGLVYIPWTNGIEVYSAHNVFLELASKYGIFPLGIYIILLIVNFRKINRANIKFSFLLLTIQIAYLLASMFESYKEVTRIFFVSIPFILCEVMDEISVVSKNTKEG